MAGCALTVRDRSETANLRSVLSRVGEFSDLFLARSDRDRLVVSDVLRPILAHVRTKYSNTQHRSWDTPPRYPGTPPDSVVCHKPTKNRSFSLFSFPDFVVRIAGYYFFRIPVTAGKTTNQRDPFRNTHNRDAQCSCRTARRTGWTG